MEHNHLEKNETDVDSLKRDQKKKIIKKQLIDIKNAAKI